MAGLFPKGFAEPCLNHKKGEIAYLSGKAAAAACLAYDEVY